MRSWGIAMALVLTTVNTAQAQDRILESSRTSNFEIRLGGYVPDIDEEFLPYSLARDADGNEIRVPEKRPYEEIFGNDDRLMVMALYEQHIFKSFGTLSAGFGAGYWSAECDGIPEEGSSATDTTEMTIVPLIAQMSYRFDAFQHLVPVVPVVRLGLDYYMWRITDGSGDVAEFVPGEPAQGATWGWHANFGLHLLLDTLAPEMAADFDRDAGVNHSYLTFDFHTANINNFGSGSSFRLGDNTVFVGLAFDL